MPPTAHNSGIDSQERFERRAQREVLSAKIHHRSRTKRLALGITVTIILGIIEAIALAISLSSCIPATPIGRPTPPTAQPAQPSWVPSPAPTPAPSVPTMEPGATPTPRCIVDARGAQPGTINVRSGPGMNYPVVDVVKDGEELPLFGEERDGWQQTTTRQLVAGWFYVTKWCKEREQ